MLPNVQGLMKETQPFTILTHGEKALSSFSCEEPEVIDELNLRLYKNKQKTSNRFIFKSCRQ